MAGEILKSLMLWFINLCKDKHFVLNANKNIEKIYKIE